MNRAESNESLGEFVRRRRRLADMSQRDLAQLASVGTRVVSEIEADKPTLRMDVVNRVLAVFGKQLGCVELAREPMTPDAPISVQEPPAHE